MHGHVSACICWDPELTQTNIQELPDLTREVPVHPTHTWLPQLGQKSGRGLVVDGDLANLVGVMLLGGLISVMSHALRPGDRTKSSKHHVIPYS